MKKHVVFGVVLGFGLLFLDVGCGSTGSKRFTFAASAGGIERDASAPFVFVNATGWTVTLTRANVTVGPIYLNVVAPLRTARFGVPFVRKAHADDSHLSSGRVVGEVLAQVTVDALSPSLVAFPLEGTITQEQVRTADIWFWPPPGVAPEKINVDNVTADLEGEAARGDIRVRFRGAIVLDEAWASDARPGEVSATPIQEMRQVQGVAASFFPIEGGTLQIRVDVRSLFRGANFENLAGNPTDADGTKRLVQAKTGAVPTDQVMRNAFQGLRAARGTWDVRWLIP